MKSKFSCIVAVLLWSIATLPSMAQLHGDPHKGQRLFDDMTCSMCHVGGGNVINPNKALKGDSFSQRYPSDADIARVVRKGVPGTSMDSFSRDRITDNQLADIIAYIRSLTPPGAGSSKFKAGAAAGSVKTGVQPGMKAGLQASAKPGAQSGTKTGVPAGAKACTQPGKKVGSQQGTKTGTKAGTKTVTKTVNH